MGRDLAICAFVIIGCSSGAPRPAPPPTTTVRPPPPATSTVGTTTDGATFAIVRWMSTSEECRGAVVRHAMFEIVDSRQLAHAVRDGFLQFASGYYVAELAMLDRPARIDPRTCISAPAYDAAIRRLVPARDLNDARQLLAALAATREMSPQQIAIAPTSADDVLGIARVRSALTKPPLLDTLEGTVPTDITLPQWGAEGDVLVIASRAGAPTRAMLADDLAAARRWVARIRDTGWPTPPSFIDDSAERRWTVSGTVVAGQPSCAARVVGTARSSSASIETVSVAMPAGAVVGDFVTAIATTRARPDACGFDMRALRVYQSGGMPVE